MQKKKYFICGICIVCLIILSGCTANVNIPKASLQNDAMREIQSQYKDYRYNGITFVRDEYDSSSKVYSMYYQIEYVPWNGLIWDLRTIKASSKYNSGDSWGSINLTVENDLRYPDSNMMLGAYFEQNNQGSISGQILSIDKESSKIKLRLNANNFTTFYGNYTLNIQENEITCPYKISHGTYGSGDNIEISLGTFNNVYCSMIINYYYPPFSGVPTTECRFEASGSGKNADHIMLNFHLN